MTCASPNYWALVFVQLLGAVFYVCSWVPLWQLGLRVGRFHRPSLNGAFMHHAPMLAALLPGGACLFAGTAALLLDEAARGSGAAPYAAMYALMAVQLALFSVWLVPYAVLREAWWSLAGLAGCALLGAVYTTLVGVYVTPYSPACLVLLVLWNGALAALAAANAMWGALRLMRYNASAAAAATFQAAPERAVLVLNAAAPASLARELLWALFCDDDADTEGALMERAEPRLRRGGALVLRG